jgi:hypothetical protein
MDGYIISPHFMRFNILFSIAFAIVTLMVSYLSYKIYKLTQQKDLKLFTGAFGCFSLAYIIQTILAFAMQYKIVDTVGRMRGMRAALPFLNLSIYTHAILFSIGLVLLTYMTFKTKHKGLLILLLGLVLIPLLTAINIIPIFHLISSFLLLFIILFYYNNYNQHKKLASKLVLLAFIFLFIGNLTFIFSVRQGIFFMLGRLLELIAYVCIVINLRLLTKK